jgi:hypothetical protein
MYLVVECMTTSAPRPSGLCRYGDAKVLSTTSSAPAECAIWDRPAMSAMFSSGFVGVSIQITLVLGRTAARTASTSDSSTGVCSMPQWPSTLSISRNVPP